MNEVGIIGAGIAGTALAIALRQAGLDVRLYEQEDGPRPAGRPADGLLELTANGTRVLHALGLKQSLAAIAHVPQFSVIRHAGTGFLLSQRPLGKFSEARYGAPSCLISRAALVGLLRESALAHNVPIEYRCAVTDVDTTAGSLTLATGETRRHPAIAVATGRPDQRERPGLANLLEARRWQTPQEITMIRATGARSAPHREHGRFVSTWLHRGRLILELPAAENDGSQQVELLLLAAEPAGTEDAQSTFEALLEPLHTQLRTLIPDPQLTSIEPLIAAPAARWHAGKAVLLGDVCHAHPTYPLLCPSAALEDAWVLSRMIERWEESPHEGFADYERYRKPRARRLRAHAEAELQLLTLAATPAVWRRNLKWSLTSRFLPEITMQRLDWLYGYDCIKGFA